MAAEKLTSMSFGLGEALILESITVLFPVTTIACALPFFRLYISTFLLDMGHTLKKMHVILPTV
jgi:hypothetical protein